MTRRLLALTLCVAAHLAQASEAPAWRAQAEHIVATIPQSGPGASILVSEGGHEIYSAVRGLASVELGAPLTVRSVFRIGSITKTVTAATALQLSAQGRLDLDAPVSKILPGFAHSSEITIRQLLSHTSGVSDAWDAPLTSALDTPARLERIGTMPLDFTPGTDWSYSNSGYMVLGAILEKITGRAWYEAERDLVLTPAGAKNLAYYDDAAVVPAMASGYTTDETGKLARPPLYSIAGPGAAGGLASDASGVADMLHGIATSRVPGLPAFRQMSTPTRIGAAELPYGLGTVPSNIQGTRVIEHSGGIEGYLAHYVYVPEKDIAVVVLENSDAPAVPARSLARRLTALALGRPYRAFTHASWPTRQLASLAGEYVIEGGGVHSIEIKHGAAWIRRDDGPAKRLTTSTDDILTYSGDGIDYLHVIRDSAGTVLAIDFHPDGTDIGRREQRK